MYVHRRRLVQRLSTSFNNDTMTLALIINLGTPIWRFQGVNRFASAALTATNKSVGDEAWRENPPQRRVQFYSDIVGLGADGFVPTAHKLWVIQSNRLTPCN
jgi:hypothetical protein